MYAWYLNKAKKKCGLELHLRQGLGFEVSTQGQIK